MIVSLKITIQRKMTYQRANTQALEFGLLAISRAQLFGYTQQNIFSLKSSDAIEH